jgi:hypothetical protein
MRDLYYKEVAAISNGSHISSNQETRYEFPYRVLKWKNGVITHQVIEDTYEVNQGDWNYHIFPEAASSPSKFF